MEINVDSLRCLCAFHFLVSVCIFTFLILRRGGARWRSG
jgi:hypothetical protein